MEPGSITINERLVAKDEPAFEYVFKTYFKDLYYYAFTILKDEMAAEEMVQQVFFKLWDKAGSIQITGSVKSYLYRAVHNESLNYLKHLKVKASHKMHVAYSMQNVSDHANRQLAAAELEKKVQEALNELPEQCRTIFQLSRFEELKYREIADQLHLSVKTVENQMGKALKLMRLKLAEFITMIILFFHL